jgi:hypothetical protein
MEIESKDIYKVLFTYYHHSDDDDVTEKQLECYVVANSFANAVTKIEVVYKDELISIDKVEFFDFGEILYKEDIIGEEEE